MAQNKGAYYIPHGSHWPIMGSLGLFTGVLGAGMWMNGLVSAGKSSLALGVVLMITMFLGWFGTVIGESVRGTYNKQVDISFRLGMIWFILSEVMFFAAFFGALLYARQLSVPWLGGLGQGTMTNYFLWPEFSAVWPTNGPANVGGAFESVSPWGIPLLNTTLLLTSGVTLTIAHHALRAGRRQQLVMWLAATVLLGAIFLGFQVYEYGVAYSDHNLTMKSGIYGSTFYLLTGFHGVHVTLGVIMLTVMTLRSAKGHFSRENHFGFEAVAWYWHFVDVVWLALFLFVYVM